MIPDMKKFILRQLADIAIALLLSTLVTYAFSGNKLLSEIGVNYKYILFGFCNAMAVWKGNQLISRLGERFFPWDKNPKLTFFINSTTSVVYTGVAIYLVYRIYLEAVFNINIMAHSRGWIWQMVIVYLVSLLITISFYLANFFQGWREAVVNEEKLKKEAIQLRYDALKSQVNPHFLFNSLSVLSALIETDTAKASQFIQKFSQIYRYVLDQRDQELVPLAEELNFVNSYIHLHRIRHGQNLKIAMDIGDQSGYIVPLSLQTVLENCFKHNTISEAHPLTIELRREKDDLVIRNNLQKRRTIQDSNGIGLETMQKRYSYLTQRPLTIHDDGESFTVRVPVIQEFTGA